MNITNEHPGHPGGIPKQIVRSKIVHLACDRTVVGLTGDEASDCRVGSIPIEIPKRDKLLRINIVVPWWKNTERVASNQFSRQSMQARRLGSDMIFEIEDLQ